ncbi:NAD(P)H-hydrate epimerase [bioreactor metagenome]|uniref:NAD(P)H-hydrate epimerase n=1 Tax=bioreactor metagenome TaxID=1076179 RepID=A0A645CFT7_9ZZZZ
MKGTIAEQFFYCLCDSPFIFYMKRITIFNKEVNNNLVKGVIKMRIGTSMSTKKLDEACANEYKIPLILMMENAVLSAIKHLDMNVYNKYVVVSGVGNNGGDGLGIARQLKARKKEVNVFIVGNMEKITPCSKTNLEILKAMNIPYIVIDTKEKNINHLEQLEADIKNSNVLVDCIFGTGLEREIKGIFKYVIEIINKNKNLVYFAVQYSYYICEIGLMCLIIVYGQKAFETLIRKSSEIPFGGVVLALTWGAVHFFSRGIDIWNGVSCMIVSILSGIMYLRLKKNLGYSYIFIALGYLL